AAAVAQASSASERCSLAARVRRDARRGRRSAVGHEEMSAEIPTAKLHEITKNVWSMVLGFRIQPVKFDAGKAGSQEFVLGKVTITGTWQGAVTLGCSTGLAR